MEDITEAVVVCLDNSCYMRNEDYIPSRWGAQTHAVSWILNSMGVSHAFGLLAMAGKRVEMLSPVITDIASLLKSLHKGDIGGDCNIHSSLQLAHMVLRNRPARCTAARVIVFSGSPTLDRLDSLRTIAQLYKKNSIALDVISFGDSSADFLQTLVNTADNNGNCHFIESSPDDPTLSISMINMLLPDDNGITPPTSQSASNLRTASNTDGEPQQPMLRMPPPNRVCRRVVVDHTKYAAQRASSASPPSTLSLSLTLSLSSPRSETSLPNNNNNNNARSSNISERDSRLVLLVPLPSQRNKRIVVEFRAGKSHVSGSSVRPMKRKGQLALLLINDDLLQFVWRDRSTGVIDIDLLVHPREATFTRVPTHITAGRVYCLHLLESHKRHFFWMQHNNVAKDDEYCEIISTYLARDVPAPAHTSTIMHPSSGSSSLSSSRPQYHALNAADLQQLLSLYSLPLSFSSRSGGNGTSRPSSSSSPTPQSLTIKNRNNNNRWSPSEDVDGYRNRWIKNPVWAHGSGRRLAGRTAEEEVERQSRINENLNSSSSPLSSSTSSMKTSKNSSAPKITTRSASSSSLTSLLPPTSSTAIILPTTSATATTLLPASASLIKADLSSSPPPSSPLNPTTAIISPDTSTSPTVSPRPPADPAAAAAASSKSDKNHSHKNVDTEN